jgi:hypothetical protein
MSLKRSRSHRAKARKSREFCIVHADGHVADAELHEPILEQGDHTRSRGNSDRGNAKV